MGRSIYITLLPLLLVGFVSESAPYLLIPSLPEITASLGLSKSQAGSLLAIYYLTLSVTFLLAGIAGDRLNKKGQLIAASAAILAGSLLLGFGNVYFMLAAGRVLQAFGAGIVVVVAQAWIGQCSTRKNITRLLSCLAIAMSFAPMVAPIAGGFINDALSWRYNFYLVAVLALISLLFLCFSSPPPPERKESWNVLAGYKTILLKTPFFAMVAMMLACFLFQGSLMSYSSFLLIGQLGVTPAVFGLISIPVVAGIITGQYLVLRFEKRGGFRAAYLFNTVVAVLALLGSLLTEKSVWSLAVMLFAFNIGFGGHNLIAVRTVLAYFASKRSYSSALMNFLCDFTNYMAALMVQLLFLFTGTILRIHDIVCTVTIVLIILCYLFYGRKITEYSVLR